MISGVLMNRLKVYTPAGSSLRRSEGVLLGLLWRFERDFWIAAVNGGLLMD